METTSSYNEKALLERIAAGDEKAFALVFEKYRQQLYTYLLRITKSGTIAEDIVSDIFMKLWLGRELVVNIDNLDGFLRKVAHNKAMDFFTTTARHTRLQKLYAVRLEPQHDKSADVLLDEQELRQVLQEAINQLPPQRKLIYTMSREQGLTYEQIAATLNLSRNTVKNTIMSATRSIGAHLQKYYPGKTALSAFFLL